MEEVGLIATALWENDRDAGGADCAGDDKNSEKSSSSSRFITGGETKVCEGVCELDRGGGESGDIMLVDSGANEFLPSDCFWEVDPWGLCLGTGGGVE